MEHPNRETKGKESKLLCSRLPGGPYVGMAPPNSNHCPRATTKGMLNVSFLLQTVIWSKGCAPSGPPKGVRLQRPTKRKTQGKQERESKNVPCKAKLQTVHMSHAHCTTERERLRNTKSKKQRSDVGIKVSKKNKSKDAEQQTHRKATSKEAEKQ